MENTDDYANCGIAPHLIDERAIKIVAVTDNNGVKTMRKTALRLCIVAPEMFSVAREMHYKAGVMICVNCHTIS